MSEEIRRCRLCGKDKPVSEFYWRKHRNTYRTDCKSCASDTYHERRQREPNLGSVTNRNRFEEEFNKLAGSWAMRKII